MAIRRFKKGERVTAVRLNEIIDAANAMADDLSSRELLTLRGILAKTPKLPKFKIKDLDGASGTHEDKITDGDTIEGTELAGFWRTTGDDGENLIRQLFLLASEIQAEATAVSGFDFGIAFADVPAFGAGPVVKDARDWRERVVRWCANWGDNSPASGIFPNVQVGTTVGTTDAAGKIPIDTFANAGNSIEIYIDGANDGKLTIERVNNGNNLQLLFWISATKQIWLD